MVVFACYVRKLSEKCSVVYGSIRKWDWGALREELWLLHLLKSNFKLTRRLMTLLILVLYSCFLTLFSISFWSCRRWGIVYTYWIWSSAGVVKLFILGGLNHLDKGHIRSYRIKPFLLADLELMISNYKLAEGW